MKKLVLVVFALTLFISCTQEELDNNEPNATEKSKVCPPSNPNC